MTTSPTTYQELRRTAIHHAKRAFADMTLRGRRVDALVRHDERGCWVYTYTAPDGRSTYRVAIKHHSDYREHDGAVLASVTRELNAALADRDIAARAYGAATEVRDRVSREGRDIQTRYKRLAPHQTDARAAVMREWFANRDALRMADDAVTAAYAAIIAADERT